MDGDRQAFQQLMLSHLDELFAAAQRDLRYHVLLGDLRQHDLSPEPRLRNKSRKQHGFGD